MNENVNSTGGGKKTLFLFGAVAAAILAAILFYFLYWVKTPQYSLGIIKTAIQKHDLVTFEKHVDLESLYGRTYDDFVASQFAGESNEFVAGLIKVMKQAIVPMLVDETKRYVETGADDKTGLTQTDVQSEGAQMADNMKSQTGAGFLEYKSVSSVKKDGKIALVNAQVYDREVDREFVLQLKMRELEDGTWQLIEFANLKDFIKLRAKAVEEKLAQLNAPLKEKLDAIIKVVSVDYEAIVTGNAWFQNYSIDFYPELQNTSGQNIKEVLGSAVVYDEEGEKLFNKNFKLNRSIEANSTLQGIYYRWSLNQFMPLEQKLIEHLLAKTPLKASFVVDTVIFADGSKIQLHTELPPVK